MDNQAQVYDLDNIPADAVMTSTQGTNFDPLEEGEVYQVEVRKAELRDNPFYKPEAKDKQDQGSKYQIQFELAVIDDGDFYGRRLWVTSSGLSFRPPGKQGASKLYKLVSKAMKTEMDSDSCNSFASDTRTFLANLQKEVVGKQIRVTVENTTNPDTKKTRTKVATYMEAKKDKKPFDQAKSDAMKEKMIAKKEKLTEDINPDDVPL